MTRWFGPIALVTFGSACTSEPDLRPQVLASLAGPFAQASYDAFATDAAGLAEAAQAACADPTETTLEVARQAWWKARGPQKHTELVKFGPTEEFPERFGPKLDRWPVDTAAVEALVAGSDDLAPAAFEQQGAVRRGMPVVEYLLWGDLEALTEDPRRCAAAMGAAGDVANNAAGLRDAWRDPWTERLTEPELALGDPYDTVQDVLDEWVNRMAFTTENIRATKFGKPLGDDAGGQILLDLLESRFSDRSLQDARDALAGVQLVWTGPDDADALGVRDLVDDEALVDQVDRALEAAVADLAQIPEPLDDTLLVQPELVQAAQRTLRTLQVAIQVDLAQALSVTITFNDNDGD